jgi:hypothetical protein
VRRAKTVPNVEKSWEPQPPGALGAYLGQYRDSFTFTLTTEILTVYGRDTLRPKFGEGGGVDKDCTFVGICGSRSSVHISALIYAHVLYDVVCIYLTLQCQSRCTVWTFNSSHADGLGALYGRKCV